MAVSKVEVEVHNNPNETTFGLANGVLIGAPSAALNSLITQSGGAPVFIKAIIASPSVIGDFTFSMSQGNGQFTVTLEGTTEFFVDLTISAAVAAALAAAAAAMSVPTGAGLAIAIAIDTAVIMAMSDPLVEGATQAIQNAISGMIEHFNNGTLDDVMFQALIDGWNALENATDPATQAIADSILSMLDNLLGSPEDPFPASNAITAMANALRLANATPICLDLTNNNLQYIPNTANSGVYFDIDADGFAEKTEWIAPDDGFLVRDLNNNGVIDSQAELFGDNAGTTAYAKLAALNTNNTGAITNDNYPCLTFPLTNIA